MSRTDLQSVEDFVLNEVIMTSERWAAPANITNIVAEINIYESIYEQYLTGSILIIDTVDLYRSLDIQGTERLQITVSLPLVNAIPITKNFVIVNAEKANKIDDFSTAYIFNIIEDIGYLDEIQKVSKAYEGKGEDIIAAILADNFKKNVTIVSSEKSYQAAFRYILPYESPITAIRKILSKITTKHGSPFFAYSTMASDSIIITDLDTILRTAPSVSRAFIYYRTGKPAPSNVDKAAYTIYEYTTRMIDDTLILSQKGTVSAAYHSFNLNTGAKTLKQFNIQQVFDSLKADGVITQDQTILLDTKFIPDPNKLNPGNLTAYSGKFFNLISASTFNNGSGRVLNYTEDANIEDQRLQIYRYGLLEFLEKNSIHVTIPGMLFLSGSTKMDPGAQLNVYIPLNVSSPSDTQIMETDNKNSGKYIIVNKRHTFNTTNQQHIVSLQLSRLSYSSSSMDHRYVSGV